MQKLKEDIRQKIIEVGKIRFKKEGFENTSMKDIATDAGISIGNIYRYFLTKKHLLDEILEGIEQEIEIFFQKVPSDYKKINLHETFRLIRELTVKIAKENNDTLKVMFNSQNQSQFVDFKEKIVSIFIEKMLVIADSMNIKNQNRKDICEAIARAEFEGFTFIVKKDIDDIEQLKMDLEIYEKLMIENLGERLMEVMR